MTSHVTSPRLAPSRILINLAEGRLDETELEALATWLSAEAMEEPPVAVLERAVRLSDRVYTTV